MIEQNKYFTAVIQYEVEHGNKMKVVKETYLVDAISPTEVEARLFEVLSPSFTSAGLDMFVVTNVAASKIKQVIELGENSVV